MMDEKADSVKELLRRIAGGDEEAFAALHQYYWNEIYSLALAFLKSPDAVEDVLQEVFVKLWLKRTSLTAIQDFTPYLMVMVRNEIISEMRRNTVRQQRMEQYLADSGALVQVPRMPTGETAILISTALARLPAKQQQIFILSREEGLSHEIIAQKTGVSKKTVSNTITIVLNHLRTFLRHQGHLSWIWGVMLLQVFNIIFKKI